MATHDTLLIAPTRIGDAVLATSILAHIQATDPEARVTIATSPLAAPLYAGYPQLARIIPITKSSYKRHWLRLWRDTVGTRWDTIWDLRNSILRFAVRSSHCHAFTPQKSAIPKVQQYAAAFGTGPLPYPTLWPRPEDTAFAAALLSTSERYLVFAPIANWPPKEWPVERFVALAKMLLEGAYRGCRPIIICAGHERERALPMLEALAAFSPVDLTEGNAHLLSIYAVMQRAEGFIGNDSGLMHMAAAAGIPTLGLFGPTPSTIYQPWGARATFIHAPGNALSQLKSEDVCAAFLAL